jgi:hypothetical protein
MVRGGTLFPHKNIHTIDYIAINRKWRASLMVVRNKRGADINSEHYLIISNLRNKMKKVTDRFSQTSKRYDMGRRKDNQTKEAFQLKLQNIFWELGEMDENEIEQQWWKTKDIYTETAKEMLGFRNPLRKEWMTKETWKKSEERRDVKRKLLIRKTRNKTEELQREYNNKAREAKRSACADQRKRENA